MKLDSFFNNMIYLSNILGDSDSKGGRSDDDTVMAGRQLSYQEERL